MGKGSRLGVLGAAIAAIVASAPEAHAAPPGPVEWREEWRRFQWWEGIATVGLTVGSIYASKIEGPDHANWSGGILLDVPIRNALQGNEHTRRAAEDYSDVGYKTATLFPYVVDAGIVALVVHQSPDVALQMSLIDLEALTLTAVVTVLAERSVGRQRPSARSCEPGSECASIANNNRGFYSGHAAATFTSAGLTCAHHQHLPLYGGGAADSWACVWALSLATMTGVFRVMSDNHYASDVIAGGAVGLASGYLLPSWLHYGFGHSKRPLTGSGQAAASGFFVPVVQRYDGGLGLGIGGAF